MFEDSHFDVPDELSAVASRTWLQVASTGTWWSGADRLALAATARSARAGAAVAETSLPDAATEVAVMLGATPAYTSRSWAGRMIDSLGEEAYVEAASVVSRVVAIDTFSRLVGLEPEPFPEPEAGLPSQAVADPPPRGSRAWVSMVGFPTPPNTFSAVPDEAAAMVDITDAYYMPEFDMQYADQRRLGLHRTQIETVAGVTSHSNECFY